MICDVFKISGDNEAIEISFEERQRSGSPLSGTKYCQQSQTASLKYLLQVYAHETTYGDKMYYYCRQMLMPPRHFEQKIKDSISKRDIETRTDLQ